LLSVYGCPTTGGQSFAYQDGQKQFLTFAHQTCERRTSERSTTIWHYAKTNQSKKSKLSFMEKLNAGLVSIGCHGEMNAALDSPRHGRMGGALPHVAGCTTMERKVLDRMDRGEGRWIELLDHSFGEEPVYRACGQNGALCRYTNDLWQAEIYVQYY
jgi:hypothetical protein